MFKAPGLFLPLFELRVLFVDYIQFAIASNYFAVNTSFLNGCSYFHFYYFKYLVLTISLLRKTICI